MALVFRLLFLACLITACSSEKKNKDLYNYIPEEAHLVIKSTDLQSLVSNIENNHFLQKLNGSTVFDSLAEKTDVLKHLNNKGLAMIAFSKDDGGALQYALLTKYTDSIFNLDTAPDHSVETITTKAQTYHKTTVNGRAFFNTVVDSIFIGATSQQLMLSALKGHVYKHKDLLKTAANGSQLSMFIDEKATNVFTELLLKDSLHPQRLTEYALLDVNLEQDEVLFNGITRATDSTQSLINAFKGTLPQKNDLPKITPSSSDGFLSLTFNNFHTFHDNLKAYQKTDSLELDKTLFGSISEIGVIYQGEQQALVLNALDETTTAQAISSSQRIDSYRSVDVLSFNQPELFENTLSPFVTSFRADKYVVLDNFFVFCQDMALLQTIIANYQNNTTLSEKSYFQNISKKLSDESSLLISVNTPRLNAILKNTLSNTATLEGHDYKWATIQFIADNNFAHIHGIIKKDKAKATEASVTEEFNIKLNERLLNTPQFVTNHLTKEKEIVVQDIKNNLYLISNKGKILWKKQLPGAILGTINQIDMYKNGRLQLAFATANRVHVIDRNGNDVKPFPLEFNDKITQPLSVFDYDNNRKYRLLVTQGKNIFMLDTKGSSVKGFTFKSANTALVHQPQHIRIGKKDYIVLKTANRLYILDRTGKPRVSPKNQYDYSDQAVYEYQGNFATTTKNGILITIDQKGNTASRDLKLTDMHHLTTTAKTLVAQSENRLTIKSNTLEMDYGNYTAPDIFYLYDKIYVTLTDLQTNKIYLFDSNGKPLDNFPVYGTSKIELDNIDKDRHLEFVTKGSDNSILIYQIN